MTIYTAYTSAQLQAALTSAHGGDVIKLAAGNYGDVTISSKNFASDVTVTSADMNTAATFRTLTVSGSSHIDMVGLDIHLTAKADTTSASSALMIKSSHDITFEQGHIEGSPAITGVAQTATAVGDSGNVIGLATGRGATVQSSTGVTIKTTEIEGVHRGVVLSASSDLKILHNEIHDMRTSAIVGGNVSNVLIDGNYLHDSNPWHWGSGDHADFIALWVDPAAQKTDSHDITVTNNLMEQGDGEAVLGMWLKGQEGLGFTDVNISNNVIMTAHTQGITLGYVSEGIVANNTLVQTEGDIKATPTILIKATTSDITATGNIAGAVSNLSTVTGEHANLLSNNFILQTADDKKSGYFGGEVDALEGLTPDAVRAAVQSAATDAVTSVAKVVSGSSDSSASSAGGGETLIGSGKNETLTGHAGDDLLDGRGGSDVLIGGAGNDRYILPNSMATVVETAGGGIDTVEARGSYVLGDNVENLTISAATNNWNGGGNALDNVLVGNAGANKLEGFAGADSLEGGAGNDSLVGGEGDDELSGGAGDDVFYFAPRGGSDTVNDFGAGTDHDRLDISAYLKLGKATLTDVDYGTEVHLYGGDTILLFGVHASELMSTSTGYII